MLMLTSLEQAMSSVAAFVISSQFIWIWCAFIMAYFFRWYLHLQTESLQIRRQLKRATATLNQLKTKKDFIQNFEKIRHQISALSLLSLPWKEYCQTLLFSTGQNSGTEEKQYEKIIATRDCHDFFSDDALISSRIDQRHLAVIPTHLSSMGILGTFCGLSSGIFLARHGLSGGNMADIQQSLSQLLSGASLAFWTSIAGITSSIFFSRFEKKVIRSLSKSLTHFNAALFGHLELVSLEHLGNQQLRQSHAQITGLEKISAGIHTLAKNRSDVNEQILRDIISEFRNTMTAACGHEIQLIAEAFRHIHSSLKETKDSLHQSGKMIHETVTEGSAFFKKNLHELSHQFQSSFSQTQELIQKSIRTSVSETQTAVKSSMSELEKFVIQPSESLGKAMAELSRQTELCTRQWVKMTEQSMISHKKVQESQNSLCQQIEPLLAASQAITGACAKAQDSLLHSSQAAGKISESVRMIEKTCALTQSSWEQYCVRFERVDQNLHQAFTQSQANLNQYSEKLRGFTLELDKYMSKGMLTLSSAVGDLHQAIAALPESLKHIKQQPNETHGRSGIHSQDTRM